MKVTKSNPGQNGVRPRPRRISLRLAKQRRLLRSNPEPVSTERKQSVDREDRLPRDRWPQCAVLRAFGRRRQLWRPFEDHSFDCVSASSAYVVEPIAAPVPPPPVVERPPLVRARPLPVHTNQPAGAPAFTIRDGMAVTAPPLDEFSMRDVFLSPLRTPLVCNCCLGVGRLVNRRCRDWATFGDPIERGLYFEGSRGMKWFQDFSRRTVKCSLCSRCSWSCSPYRATKRVQLGGEVIDVGTTVVVYFWVGS